MRIYTDNEGNELNKVICNQCKRELVVENGILKEGCYHGKQVFGYFSNKDGIVHNFDLCEACYYSFINAFKIPVLEEDYIEFV